MDISERRIFGALFLLLGLSCLAVALYTDQIESLVELLKTAFRTVIT